MTEENHIEYCCLQNFIKLFSYQMNVVWRELSILSMTYMGHEFM